MVDVSRRRPDHEQEPVVIIVADVLVQPQVAAGGDQDPLEGIDHFVSLSASSFSRNILAGTPSIIRLPSTTANL